MTVVRAELALTMDDELGLVRDPIVVIEDGRIVAVRSGHGGEPDRADDVLDLGDRWLLPGFVNAHTHAAMALLRGYADDLPLRTWLEEHIWPVEAELDADHVRSGTLLAVAEMLAGGVTTFADMYLHMEGAAEAAVEAGIRAVLAPGLLDALGPHDEVLERAVTFARDWDGAADGRIRVMLAPHSVYACEDAFLRDIAAAARELGVRLQMHLAETEDEVEAARERTGASPVQIAADAGILDAGCTAAHCVWLDDTDVRLLAESGTGVAHNPRSNMMLASGVAPVGRLLDAGIAVGLGTDGAASTNQLTMLEEMRAASMLQKVTRADATALPAREVLALATSGGARALGLDGEIGSLTPGKRADLVALRVDRAGTTPSYDPYSTVAYSVQDQDVDVVIVDGEVVVRDGVPTRIDPGSARRDAERHAERLTGAHVVRSDRGG